MEINDTPTFFSVKSNNIEISLEIFDLNKHVYYKPQINKQNRTNCVALCKTNSNENGNQQPNDMWILKINVKYFLTNKNYCGDVITLAKKEINVIMLYLKQFFLSDEKYDNFWCNLSENNNNTLSMVLRHNGMLQCFYLLYHF